MRKLTFIFLTAIIAVLTSCRKDFDTVPSSGGLEFSAQTVYLDTIFTGISSSTYMLKVYNRSNDDISIPAVRLEKGDASKYRIMVDGMTGAGGKGKYFPDVEILAKDSLFIFIETTVNIAEAEADFTYNDRILFDIGANEQSVSLVTLIQDAHFIYPNRDLNGYKEHLILAGSTEESDFVGHTLTDDQLNWTNDKPWVVYGYAHVPAGKELHIAAGTKVHFHAESGILVDQNARIVIDGDISDYDAEGNILVDREVTFEGDRLEPRFAGTPGQWGTVLILSQLDNQIDHLTLKNSTIGLFLAGQHGPDLSPKVTVTNSQIYNTSNIGVYGRNANVTAENLVVNFAGLACFAATEGGTYSVTHCTLNNDWQSTNQVTVLIDNYSVNEQQQKTAHPLATSFKNSIIYGSNRVQLTIDMYDVDFTQQDAFQNCLIKFDDSGLPDLQADTNYDFIRNQVNGNIKNQDPKFANRLRNWLIIPTDSPAANAGSDLFQTTDNKDIFGLLRDNSPDLGAYNAVDPG